LPFKRKSPSKASTQAQFPFFFEQKKEAPVGGPSFNFLKGLLFWKRRPFFLILKPPNSLALGLKIWD
jgi:hypothetical protein